MKSSSSLNRLLKYGLYLNQVLLKGGFLWTHNNNNSNTVEVFYGALMERPKKLSLLFSFPIRKTMNFNKFTKSVTL